tara:strand:- start:11039 stop:12190 length:1152 start_codon:yes stop_codon:yes gene_type:complete
VSVEFLKVIDNAKDTTVVVFSSANVPPNKFSAIHALKDFNANLVFINCPHNNWYIKPIPGLGDSVPEVSQNIMKALKSLGTKRSIFYGGSMGAYGAILYGALCNGDKAIVTGVEAELGAEGGYYNSLCRDKLEKTLRPSLTSILASSAIKTDILIGEACFSDHTFVQSLREFEFVKIRTITNGGHRVPPFIDKKIGLRNLIESMLHDTENELLKNISTDIIGNCEVYHEIKNAIINRSLSEEEVGKLEEYVNFPGSNLHYKSYAFFALSLVLPDNIGKTELIEKAIELNESNYLFLDYMSETQKKLGKIVKALHYAQKCAAVIKDTGFESYEFYTLKTIVLLEVSGQIERAKNLLSVIESTIPSNGNMRENFDAISSRLSRVC